MTSLFFGALAVEACAKLSKLACSLRESLVCRRIFAAPRKALAVLKDGQCRLISRVHGAEGLFRLAEQTLAARRVATPRDEAGRVALQDRVQIRVRQILK